MSKIVTVCFHDDTKEQVYCNSYAWGDELLTCQNADGETTFYAAVRNIKCAYVTAYLDIHE